MVGVLDGLEGFSQMDLLQNITNRLRLAEAHTLPAAQAQHHGSSVLSAEILPCIRFVTMADFPSSYFPSIE